MCPPNIHVSPSILAIQTHPDYWDEPLVWKPSRWIHQNPQSSSDTTSDLTSCLNLETIIEPLQGTYLPWSDGPQNCPGKRFSLVEFTAVIACLLRDHRVEIVGEKGESFEGRRERALRCAEDCSFQTLLRMRAPERVDLAWRRV
ncbi:cytochrome P450 [Halenospora varia]|nr:cytochrome P450 [Halenospora varia]